MNLARLRPADWLAGIAGLVSFLLLWAPWYGVSDGTLNGWQAFGFIDVLIVLTAGLAISLAVVTARRDTPAVPLVLVVVGAPIASLTALLVIFRLLDIPQGNVTTGREWGAFAGAIAVLVTAVGLWLSMRDERGPGLRPNPEARTMPAPEPGSATSEA